MSEALKNFREFRGIWCARFASIPALIFSIIVLALGPAGIANGYVGGLEWEIQYTSIFTYGSQIVKSLKSAWYMVFILVIIAFFGILVAWQREKIGLRVSGFLTIIFFIGAFISYILYLQFVNYANYLVVSDVSVGETIIATYSIGGYVWNTILGLWVVGLIFSFLYIIGAFQLVMASPIPYAKYRAKRMKILTKADAAERGGRPREAIMLYKQAGDLSMKLREEDKATEYYQKSREIEETEIIAVLEREEELKRKELAERRAKLEEERKEILIRADQAEEKEQFLRASTLYREAAAKSVDLGEKKLAAQFTAKAKELKRKAMKLKKEREEKEKREQE
ncbi:MAG: hypothetical protein ACTSPQ_04235 [Candidatus Helarchaeota archaeon]